MSTENLPQLLQDVLLEGEKILWTGFPEITWFRYVWLEVKSHLTSILIIPGVSVVFSLLFAEKDNRSPVEIWVFAILSAIIALLLFGIAWLISWRRKYLEFKNLRYVITQQRILLRSKSGIVSAHIGSIGTVTRTDDPDSLGSLQLKVIGGSTLWLFRVRDSDAAYRIITELQGKQPTQ